MPVLTGSALADASGTALEDASSAALGEPDLQVAISSAGVLMEAVQMGVGPWWEILLEILVPAIVESVLGPSGPTLAQVNANIDEVREVIDPQPGVLPNVRDEVLFLSSDHEFNIQTLKTLIEALEPGGLTTDEHDHLVGLENADPSVIATNVWGYVVAVDDLRESLGGISAVQVIENLWYAALVETGFNGIRAAHNPYFAYIAYSPSDAAGAFGNYLVGSDPTTLPTLDLTLVEEGDTVWSYLTREYSAWSWTKQGPGDNDNGSEVWLGTAGVNTVAGWRCLLTDADLAGIWRAQEIPPDEPAVVPPVWPGSAGVTLGTPVALVDQLHLVGTMDGIIVNVTTPPSKVGKRAIGGAFYDYNTGEVAFETDSGDIEPWQYLGFRDAIFTPKTMTSAAGVRLRVLAGAEGTVTPWVKS